MKGKFKIWFDQKIQKTTIGYAYTVIQNLYEKNIYAFSVEMIISLVVSVLVTGMLVLLMMNLAGNGYTFSLYNIFAAWIQSGILISVFMFFVIQSIIAKVIQLFSLKYIRDTDRNIDVSTEGVYGTAHMMTREEMKKTFVMDTLKNNKETLFGRDPENPNIVVGQNQKLLKINKNVLMIAGPSAGKSATFVIPMVMQMMRRGESACISDPKGELFKILGELGKKLGYEVRILNLNPMFLGNSDPCNFLKYVGDDVDKAQVVSKAIIVNTTEIYDFWAEGAENLLQFLMLYLNCGNTFRENQKNLPFVFKWLVDHSQEEIDEIIYDLPEEHPGKAPGMIFAGGEEKVKKQTLQGLRIKLKLFNSPKLRKILSKTEGSLDILNPGRKKCLYFIGSNDQDTSMEPIVSLFYTLLYQELVRYADKRKDQKLPIRVHMVLDEYANMCTIPDFEKKLSTVRSRDIVTYIILQDINQLKAKHPMDTWKTVVNDCDYYLMLKTNDIDTMEWWNKMCGEMTVNVKNSRYDKSKFNISGFHVAESVTEGLGERDTLTNNEVRKLEEDEVLVLVSQRNPVKLKTIYWETHPYAKHVEEVLPTQHYPLWRLIEEGVVNKDYDYDHEPSIIMDIEPDEEIEIDEEYDPDKMLNAFSSLDGKINVPKTVIRTFDKVKGMVKTKSKEEEKEKESQKEKSNNELRTVERKPSPTRKQEEAKQQRKPEIHEGIKPKKESIQNRTPVKRPQKPKPDKVSDNRFFDEFDEQPKKEEKAVAKETDSELPKETHDTEFEEQVESIEKTEEQKGAATSDGWEDMTDISSFWEEF